jgi:hypothetical protein
MRYSALVGVLLLCSCATAPPPPQYIVRPTGRTPQERMQSVLTQCQGEAAATPQSLYISGGLIGLAGTLAARSAQDNAIISACMARNGYPKGTY